MSRAPLALALLPATAAPATASSVRWVASTETSRWQERAVAEAPAAEPDLELLPARLQRVEGFGGCFNEAGWEALSRLGESGGESAQPSSTRRTAALHLLPLADGSHDYALEWYSLDEVEDDFAMKEFSIARDERYLIPYIKAALALRPDLTLFASPWSPPTWMKLPRAYNHGRIVGTRRFSRLTRSTS